MSTDESAPGTPAPRSLAAKHFRLGWLIVTTFVLLGALLDALHAFKVGYYLDVGAETRRLMWTLAHAHGLGLGIVHMGFAATVAHSPSLPIAATARASGALSLATILMPTGFFLGGFGTLDGDPGPGIFVVPLGGLVLFVAAAVMARALSSGGPAGQS